MSGFHLAQINVARMRYPLEDQRMVGFESRLDEINALAESSAGFVWRFVDESGNATATRPMGEDWLINMSVWASIDFLKDYVYGSAHRDLLAARREWFHSGEKRQLALWWLPVSQLPTVDDGIERLRLIREHGPTPRAFNFGKVYPAPSSALAHGE